MKQCWQKYIKIGPTGCKYEEKNEKIVRADTTHTNIWTDLLYIMIDLVALSCLSLPSPAHWTLNSEHPELSSQEYKKTGLNESVDLVSWTFRS